MKTTPFADLATAARALLVGDTASFYANHCDPLYNADEQLAVWRFDIVQNDDEALLVRRQYRNNAINLTAFRDEHWERVWSIVVERMDAAIAKASATPSRAA